MDHGDRCPQRQAGLQAAFRGPPVCAQVSQARPAAATPVYGIIPVYGTTTWAGEPMSASTAGVIREAEIHRLIAGDRALDFANTLNGHRRRNGHEYLHDFIDLAIWCRHAGILSPHETRNALKQAAQRPTQARQVYRRALVLRETIFRVYYAIASGVKPSWPDLRTLSDAWREAQGHAEIAASPTGFALGWDEEALLEQIPRRLVSAAVNTLISERASRIKACAGDGCDWLFVDSSRNHLRRWCSMDECGNRAKMRRRRLRKPPMQAGATNRQKPRTRSKA